MFESFWVEQLVIFLIYLFFKLLGTVAGTGGGLTTPAMVALGYPPKVSIGTGYISSIGRSGISLFKFYKEGLVDMRKFAPYVAISIIAALIGVNILVSIDTDIFKKLIGYAVLVVVPLSFSGLAGLESKNVSKFSKYFSYVIHFFAYLVSQVVGSGTGIINSINYIRLAGMSMLETSAIKSMTGVIISPLSFAILWYKGFVKIEWIPVMLLGGVIGGYIGSHIAIKKGNKFVRAMLIVVALSSAVRIILS